MMSHPLFRFRSAPRPLLLGLAALLFLAPIVGTVTFSLLRCRSELSAPARLPVDSAIARLESGHRLGVAVTEHLESVGGSLEFAPPPLSKEERKPAVEVAPSVPVQPRPPLRNKFNPAGLLGESKPLADPPRADKPQPQTSARTTRRAPKTPEVARQDAPLAAPEISLPPPTAATVLSTAPSAVTPAPAKAANRPVVEPLSAGVLPPPDAPPTAGMANAVPAPDGQFPPAFVAGAPKHPPRVVSASTVSQPPLVLTMGAPLKPASQRSTEWQRQMWPVAIRADEQVRRGFETCGRGALFAGRSELIQALRMIAQNADAIEGGTVHSDALAAGMRAMTEAEDFVVRGSRLESELDMATLVAAHRTPAVRETLAGRSGPTSMTPLEAQNRYYTYAQQQLATAAAGLPVGGIALYGLGKIHTTLATADSDAKTLEEPQAMTLYQAALLADPGNPLAAHELGVMLARHQRNDEALAMLQHSARTASLPETWKNLAVLHARRGETDLSRRAAEEAKNAQARLSGAKPASHPALARSSVRWLSPEEFSRSRTLSSEPITARQEKPAGGTPASVKPPAAPAAEPAQPSGILSWLPWTTKQ